MKTDMYTKVILTVIAIFLALNFFKDVNIVPAAQAAVVQIPEPKRTSKDTVIIGGIVDVNVLQANGQNLFLSTVKLKDGSQKALLPISLEYEDLRNALQVSFSSSSPIPVDIREVGGNKLFEGNLPVSIY